MELMQVILHSDAIERFEKLYPDIKHSDYLLFSEGDESKQNYLHFLGVIQDLKIIHLVYSSLNMLGYFYYPNNNQSSSENHEEYLEYSESGYFILEELIKEYIYDPRIGLGYCTQCHTEYPLKIGCTQTKRIYGKCNPKNFLPFFDKEGKKVFKGGRHYKHCVEWDPDEYTPHSPEIMKKNRQFMREQRAFQEEWAKEYETRNEPDKAEHVRKNKIKEF